MVLLLSYGLKWFPLVMLVLFLVGIVLPGLSMLLSFLALGLRFGILGLRLWKGLPPVPAVPEVEAEAGAA